MKIPVIILQIAAVIIFAVAVVFCVCLYDAWRVNVNLVERYAEPAPVVTEEIFAPETIEDQEAATSRAKYRRTRTTVTAPTTAIATTTKPATTSTATTSSASAPAPGQKIVTGIAAGYVLSTMTEAQIRNYFSEMKKLGMTWVRFDINWSGVQHNGPTSYNWTEIDRIVKLGNEYGMNMLAILAYSPSWAAKDGCVMGQNCAPKDPTSFATFAGVAATRYKNNITAWEIWNEPNMDYFWSPKANGTEYTAVLKAGYAAIKTAQPGAIVITGGLSPVTSSGTTVDPLVFLKDMYAAGGKGSFDAIGHHPYTYALSPASTLPWNHWYQMYKIYDLMNKNGDAAKKVWITEIGAPTGGSGIGRELGVLNFNHGSDYLTQNAQAETIAAVISESNKITRWLGPVFWYSLIDINSKSTDPEGHFGLITSDNKYKAAHNTLLNTK
ncbi:MAG: hypothetical protein RLZZ360_115 [Candidatus Parcubacteria bacterium]|jgi:hypothetical protein